MILSSSLGHVFFFHPLLWAIPLTVFLTLPWEGPRNWENACPGSITGVYLCFLNSSSHTREMGMGSLHLHLQTSTWEALSWGPAELVYPFACLPANGDLRIANPAGVAHFHLSPGPASLPALSRPCHSVCSETAGIIQPSSAHPEGCDSEFLCQVYFDTDKKLHAVATGHQEDERVRKALFPLPNACEAREESKRWPVPKWPANKTSLTLHHIVLKAGTQC